MPNDDSFSRFWEAVWSDEIKVTENGLLELQSGWGPSKVRFLYPRDCYTGLLHAILSGSWEKFLVLGSPGIGKSLFVYYFIYFISKNTSLSVKPTFVLSDLDKNEFLFTHENNKPVVRIYNRSMEVPTYYLSDTQCRHNPPYSLAYIHVTSISNQNYESLYKEVSENGRIWNMSVFTYEEYLKISKFPDLPILSLFKYDVFGGSARLLSSTVIDITNIKIFEFVSDQMNAFFDDVFITVPSTSSSSTKVVPYKECVGKLIWTETAKVIVNALTKPSKNQSSSGVDPSKRSIFQHYFLRKVDGEFELHLDFASPFMKFLAGSFCAKKHQEIFSEIEKLFGGSGAGIAFERIAHEKLYELFKSGGKIKVQHLCGRGRERIDQEIEPKVNRKVFIRTIEDIKSLTPTDYGIPIIPNFALVDAIIAPNILLQMTRSDSHTGAITKLPEICRNLSQTPENVMMIFVLDYGNFAKFTMVGEISTKQYKYRCVGDLSKNEKKRKYDEDDEDAVGDQMQTTVQRRKKKQMTNKTKI